MQFPIPPSMWPSGGGTSNAKGENKVLQFFVIAFIIAIIASSLFLVSTQENPRHRTIGYLIHAGLLFIFGFLVMLPRLKDRVFGIVLNKRRIQHTSCQSCGYCVSDVQRHEAVPGTSHNWATCPECGRKYNVASVHRNEVDTKTQ